MSIAPERVRHFRNIVTRSRQWSNHQLRDVFGFFGLDRGSDTGALCCGVVNAILYRFREPFSEWFASFIGVLE